jgi:ssDNA-binding Zn-finger/Zn-ribbon topoisomerase 1
VSIIEILEDDIELLKSKLKQEKKVWECKQEENEQLKQDKQELLDALVDKIGVGCNNCPNSDIIEIPNTRQCKGCGYYGDVKLIEKHTNK